MTDPTTRISSSALPLPRSKASFFHGWLRKQLPKPTCSLQPPKHSPLQANPTTAPFRSPFFNSSWQSDFTPETPERDGLSPPFVSFHKETPTAPTLLASLQAPPAKAPDPTVRSDFCLAIGCPFSTLQSGGQHAWS